MARREQEAGSELRRPLLQDGQQQQQQPAPAAPAAAPASRPSRGPIASEDTDGLVKWGPIAVVILVLLACGAFAGTIVLLSGGPGGDPPPLGRKGCAAAVIGERQVFNDIEPSELDRKKPRSEPGPRLLIWGGKGRHQTIFNDLYELDLIKGHWRRMAPRAEKEDEALETIQGAAAPGDALSPASGVPRRALAGNATAQELAAALESTNLSSLEMPPSNGLPRGRWKMVSSGIPTRHGDGMVVYGGDTLVKAENKGDYLSDVWLLQPKPHGAESAVWHPSTASDSDDGPEGRRAAAGAVWHGPGQAEPPKLLVHGGRNKRGDQLNDLWSASLDWPNVDWTLLDDGSDSKHCPEPRKGHTATMRPGTAPHLLVYGGRNETSYFDDLWAYDLEFNSWEKWLDRSSAGPMGRDHHAAVVVGNQFIIYGGRGGASYTESKILSDIWSLDLTTMNWTEVTPKDGPTPPARFLHSFDMFLPPKGSGGDALSSPGSNASARPYGIVERHEGPAANEVALRGTLTEDEAQLAGRRLLSSKSLSSKLAGSYEALNAADGSVVDSTNSRHEAERNDKDHDDEDHQQDSDDEDSKADDSDDEDKDEDDIKDEISTGAAALNGNATPSLAPGSGDLDKHHNHHHHHDHHDSKKHHKHNGKHHKEEKHGKHHKGGKGGLDPHPGPAGGSYSDAKLVVFGGQGEGGCYLNDAWEFDPHAPAWRQISRLVSDDKKCIALQGLYTVRGPRSASRLFGGLGWGAARPTL